MIATALAYSSSVESPAGNFHTLRRTNGVVCDVIAPPPIGSLGGSTPDSRTPGRKTSWPARSAIVPGPRPCDSYTTARAAQSTSPAARTSGDLRRIARKITQRHRDQRRISLTTDGTRCQIRSLRRDRRARGRGRRSSGGRTRRVARPRRGGRDQPWRGEDPGGRARMPAGRRRSRQDRGAIWQESSNSSALTSAASRSATR